MNLTVVGCSPAAPAPGQACSSYLLAAGEASLLLDCGHGACSSVQSLSDLRSISAILISHMHPDHFLDLVPLHYAIQFAGVPPIPLFLPPTGVDTLRKLQGALDLPDVFFSSTFDLEEFNPGKVLVPADGISVEFAPTIHFIPAFAMRIRESRGNRSLFFSSDTGPESDLATFANAASLALIEATLESSNGQAGNGHLSGTDAGRLARESNVDRVVLTHYWPESGPVLLREASDAFSGPVFLAEQGRTYPV